MSELQLINAVKTASRKLRKQLNFFQPIPPLFR
jgi:hypothetical protein